MKADQSSLRGTCKLIIISLYINNYINNHSVKIAKNCLVEWKISVFNKSIQLPKQMAHTELTLQRWVRAGVNNIICLI